MRESSEVYGGAMRIQRDRLGLAAWLRSMVVADTNDPVVKLEQGGRDQLMALCDSLASVEMQLRSHPTVSDTLDRETLRQRSATEEVLGQLTQIQTEIAALERNSVEAQAAANQYDRIERFLGRLEQALQLYDRADQSSGLREEIAHARSEIARLQATISEAEIRRKLDNALNRIQNSASKLVPQLDAEWPDALCVSSSEI